MINNISKRKKRLTSFTTIDNSFKYLKILKRLEIWSYWNAQKYFQTIVKILKRNYVMEFTFC